jgi:hypothetical protein
MVWGTQMGLAQTGPAALLDVTSGAVVCGFPAVSGTNVDVAVPDGAGGWYIGGNFTAVGGAARSRIAHVLANNSVAAWNPGANGRVFALAVSGSTVYAAGEFRSIGGQARNFIAALDATTGAATAWNPNPSGPIFYGGLAVDGATVYVGGSFNSIGGQARSHIAALDATTGLATPWNPNAVGGFAVGALVSSGMTLFVGGAFTSIGGHPRNNIAGLDKTTGLATSWNPNSNARVQALALSGTTLFAGGAFTNIGGQARNFIAALDLTTGAAKAWNPSPNHEARTLAASGTTLYVGGFFSTIGGQARNGIAALDATTRLATPWNPNASGPVDIVAVVGSTVFAGGSFGVIGALQSNCAPSITLPGPIAVDEGAAVEFSATATDADVPAQTLTFSLASPSPVGAAIDPLTGAVSWGTTDNGSFTIRVAVDDGHGGVTTGDVAVTVSNVAPVVTITGPPSGAIFPVGTPVTFTGAFTDPGTADTHTAEWMFDTITQVGTVTETDHSVSATRTFSSAGVYMVKLTVADDDGGVGIATTVGGPDAMVVIYDPSGGFVTGGGWINSPAGGYVPSPDLTGNANFGFVSKYQKGNAVPTGETEFQFSVAGLHFHSSSYDWLVIAGSRAQYKGRGTINGLGSYSFLLTATDGQASGGGGTDKLRMTIMDRATSQVVYDNQLGALDGDAPTTVLGGGSIVIQSAGKTAPAASIGPPDASFAGVPPREYALYQNYPNPFQASTNLSFDLPFACEVVLAIFDIRGRQMDELVNGPLKSGRHGYSWTGVDGMGRPLDPGVYFIRFTARPTAGRTSFAFVKKLVLAR